MGAATNFSAAQAAEGLNILAMSGFDAAQSMEMIEDVLHLAAAGSMDMASAAGYISGAMKGFNDETKDSVYYADLMAKGATLANTSVSQLGEAMASGASGAAAYGQSAESMTVALLRLAEQGEVGSAAGTALAAAMKDLYTPSDQAASALAELGVAAYENGQALDFNEIVNNLSDALSGMSDEEANAYKQTIFGIQGLRAFNQMTVTSTEKQNEWADALANAAGEASKQYDTMTDNLQGDLDILSSAMDGLKIAVSDQLTPTLREFTQFASDSIGKVTAAFKEGGIEGAMDALAPILSDGIAMITEKIPDFIDAGMRLLSALGQGLLDNLPMLASAATELILGLTQFIIGALPELVRAGFEIISTVAQGLAEALPELIPAIVDVILEIVDVLTQPDNIIMLLDAAIAIVIGLADGIIKSLPKLLERMPEIIVNIVGALLAAAPELAKGVWELGYHIITGIIDGAMHVMDNLSEIWESIKNAFANAWENIKGAWAGVGQWFGEKWSDIKSRFADAKEWFGKKFTEAKEAAQKAWDKIGDWFGKKKEEAQKAWNGFDTWMGDHFGKVWEAIKKPFKKFKEFFDGLIQIIKDVFSGNKSLLEVGTDIVNGIWNGIKGAADQFAKNVKEFFGGIVDGVKDFLGIHSPSKLFKDQIGKMIGLGVAEGIEESEDKAVKAAEKLAKDVYSKSKDWIDKQTKYNKWSLDEQLEAWQAAQEQFIEGSKQYADAEEQIFDLREKIRERDEKAVEEQVKTYTSKIEEGLAKVRDLWDNYESTYEKERNSIYGAFGLFASPKDREYVEGVDLLDNLHKQIRDINQFYDGLEQLQSRGLSRELVDEIRAMGPSAINEVQGLLDLSQEQLDEYAEAYTHKIQVTTYWTDRYTDNLRKITEGSIMRIFDGLDVTMDDALDAAYNWGHDYMEQLAKGIQAGEVEFFNTDQLIAGRLSGDSRWSGDMNVVINTLAGQSAVEIANMTYKKIINEFTNRKQVWA